MKERPILFSGPMVRAILEGRKTMTRRVVKPGEMLTPAQVEREVNGGTGAIRCPYGKPGDRLWVRETIELRTILGNNFPSPVYVADGSHVVVDGGKKASNHAFIRRRVTPSIHMPRWASRITLEVTGVRVERLQDISEADAKAEGSPLAACGAPQDGSHKAGFADIWASIHGTAWDANPFVWVIEFRRVS